MAKRAWSHDNIVKLIVMYEGTHMLWDCRSNEYKNRDQKNAALKEMGEVFNCTNEEVLRKIHNVRNQVRINFTRTTKNKEEKSDRAGGEEKNKWQYFNAMKFVVPTMMAKSTSNLV
ncbi:hypothetical protein PR048_019512, partial [Dryococelus australis]